ncbi:hypothetical protein [Lactococcus lactis]|jgi:hypothetical protein|uniref:hypothetical protein n=1 Tax=Lactococcus lactis TaxID=1358 RepID=UPI0011112A72|nr:hypothetical protein [Lactococcus lactis]DAO53968.1 MAG TPA: hypothetical protein [Caudoviricetes sp.]MDT2861766.1 hypothetical protein [Lactococcus lactis]MDT2870148.1 hypothetical protein [Lactococcus lactis]MDT2891792.1 hypothetical protein [Lactococcus lactis]MDT2913074.1 hypothetical protein [Lactococcus lactis]
MSQNTKTILSNLFTLTSELSEPTSKLIHIEGANETPATQKDLAKGLRENLVNLTEVLGLSVDELTEPQEYEPQETVKSIIEEMQQLTFAPHEISGNDTQVFADLLTDSIERLVKALGLNEMSLSAENKNKPHELALKAQLQDLYSLNDSMVTSDPNHVPRYTDGTIITLSDLVDMNVQALDNIAELIGFELEE